MSGRGRGSAACFVRSCYATAFNVVGRAGPSCIISCPDQLSISFLLLLVCRAHGFVFDQAAFILAHRRKAKVAAFLQQFRNSQASGAAVHLGCAIVYPLACRVTCRHLRTCWRRAFDLLLSLSPVRLLSRQMLEVFITERLKLASEGFATADRFELKVSGARGVEGRDWCACLVVLQGLPGADK